MRFHDFFIFSSIPNLSILLFIITDLKQNVLASNMSIYGILGLLFLEIQGLKCDFSHPKIIFLAFYITFHREKNRNCHKNCYDIKEDVWGTYLSIFKTVVALCLVLGGAKVTISCQKWIFFASFSYVHHFNPPNSNILYLFFVI